MFGALLGRCFVCGLFGLRWVIRWSMKAGPGQLQCSLVPSMKCLRRTLKNCIGVASGTVMLEGSMAFGSGERVRVAGGLVSVH